jgi:hypothetical protein
MIIALAINQDHTYPDRSGAEAHHTFHDPAVDHGCVPRHMLFSSYNLSIHAIQIAHSQDWNMAEMQP